MCLKLQGYFEEAGGQCFWEDVSSSDPRGAGLEAHARQFGLYTGDIPKVNTWGTIESNECFRVIAPEAARRENL